MGKKTVEQKSRNAKFGLSMRIHKTERCLRERIPKHKRVSKKAPVHISVVMDYFLKELFRQLQIKTDQGKHQVTPSMIAKVFGNRKSSIYGIFPKYIGGVYVSETPKPSKVPRKKSIKKPEEEEEIPTQIEQDE